MQRVLQLIMDGACVGEEVAKFILANSIVMGGQKGGLRLQEDSSIAYYIRGTSAFYNSFLHATTNVVDVQTGLTIPGIPSYDVDIHYCT